MNPEHIDPREFERPVLDTVEGFFIATSKDKAWLEELVARNQEMDKEYEYVVLPFGVEIVSANPYTKVVEEWRKGEGFSIWRKSKQNKE